MLFLQMYTQEENKRYTYENLNNDRIEPTCNKNWDDTPPPLCIEKYEQDT